LLPGSFPVFDLLEQGEGEGKLLAQVGEVFEGCGWVATLVGGQGQVDPGAGKAGLFGNDVFQELAGGLGLALFEQAEGLRSHHTEASRPVTNGAWSMEVWPWQQTYVSVVRVTEG